MFNMHGHRGGARGAASSGSFERGPFSVSWEVHGRGRGGMRRGGGDGSGGGPRGRRMFDTGELRLVLLKLIGDEPRHGYDLIRAIEALTGGAYAPSPGVVYPTLTLLDEMGLIEERQSEGSKKRFAATSEGQAHLVEHAEQVDALIARLTGLAAEHDRVGWNRAPVRRAMGNLREAIQNRFPRGEGSDEALFEIAALIDAVAQQIERLK